MGNGLGKIGLCFSGTNDCGGGRRGTSPSPDPYDDTMGHSFIYTRPDPAHTYSDPTPTTLFRSISGASVSANTSTPLSTAPATTSTTLSSAFDSSTSFSSIPLHPIPKSFLSSGPLSGPTDSTFLSGPIDRAFMSGPLDRPGPLHKTSFKRSLSQTGEPGPSRSMIRGLKRAISKKLSRGQRSIVAPMKGGEIKYHDTWITDHDSVQWAQGKAGEDRVHVVVSDDHGLVFVGIYDGFHGPDATDFLLTNLYSSLQDEIKGLLWDDHSEVLSAMSRGLKRTEEGYFEVADTVIAKNPELSLMGSCVLVVLMKGEDVYVMNVGDSRAVLGTKRVSELGIGIVDKDLERINEESCYDVEMMFDGVRPTLSAFQLSLDHSTAVDEEVQRIRSEHPDDSCAVVQDRVKGSLMVTRAFGAGYLKQPKWNDALLEMFRIDYVGTSSYMNCLPSLHHHRLGPSDRFLILSSDGLYQYFTNEEAVSEVELFTSLYPDGDPAQHLVEEVLFRAAKKAGMDFYELLEIPQGERRRYHDDVSIVIISFEGMIWRSCV